MKNRPRPGNETGATLLELTIAMALLAMVLGAAASSLSQFYNTMDIEEQRIEAMQANRAVIEALREKRADYVDVGANQTSNFPAGLITYIGTQNTAGWTAFLRKNVTGLITNTPNSYQELPNHAINVTVTKPNGQAVANTDNPVLLHVTSTWNDRRGRAMRAQMLSLLSDR